MTVQVIVVTPRARAWTQCARVTGFMLILVIKRVIIVHRANTIFVIYSGHVFDNRVTS